MFKYILPFPSFVLKTGDRIVLKADNGLYFARVPYGPHVHEVWAALPNPESGAQFTVTVLERNVMCLASVEGGKFAVTPEIDSTLKCAGTTTDDPYCKFTVSFLDDGKILMSSLPHLHYFLSRINVGVDEDPIKLAKGELSIDKFCAFTVQKL
jgi:hypothetical protein